jgi:hypothetical protein
MRDYVVSHILSIAIPLTLLVYGSFFWGGSDTTYWTFLLVFTFILGYIHYFVGAFYQLRSFSRKEKSVRHFVCFTVLVIVSIGLSWFLIGQGLIFYLSILVILFFNIHGFLNEKTLLKTQTNLVAPQKLFLPWALVTSGLVFMAVTHPSSLYDYFLGYQNTVFIYVVNDSFKHLVMFGKIIFIMGICTVCFVLVTTTWNKIVFSITLASLGVATILYAQSPLTYVYIFSFLLSYHFIQWSITYWLVFYRSRQMELPTYMALHVLIILVCLSAYNALHSDFITSSFLQTMVSGIFDLRTFIALAMVHLTTSLMNEDFVKKFLKLN